MIFNVILRIFFWKLRNLRKRDSNIVYIHFGLLFIWFANFCVEIVEWRCDEKIELLINFSLQNTSLCGVKWE